MAFVCFLPVEEPKNKQVEELLCNHAEVPVTLENTRSIIHGLVVGQLISILRSNVKVESPI